MRALPLLLVVLAGCSSAPVPPRIDPAPPSPAPSVSASAAPSVSASTTTPVASAVSAPAPPDAKTEASEDVDRTRNGTRLALPGGAELVIAVSAPSAPNSPPEVTLTLVRGEKEIARRDGFFGVTGAKAKILTSAQACESWRGSIRREAFGATSGVRVSIACSTGEDYFSATELAVLFRLDEPLRDLDGLTRIWAGLGAAEHREMDSCLGSREVSFRLINLRTLEKTITEQTRWVEQSFADELKKKLKKGCKVGETKRVERVVLPGG
jgi:hypothetical protein